MDRSLNGDDFRILDRSTASTVRQAFMSPPTLDELPGWFRRLVLQQAQELGVRLPASGARGRRAA